MSKKFAAFLFAAGVALSFGAQAQSGGPGCTFVCDRDYLDCVEFGRPACVQLQQACIKECFRR